MSVSRKISKPPFNSKSLTKNEEDEEIDDYKRKSRNLSEKKRRDQFNNLIIELNSIVSSNSRKMDKSTVLEAAINTMKMYKENIARSKIYEINEEWKPSFLTNDEYSYLMLETLEAFIVVFSSDGKILYASSNLTTILGYLLEEIVNLNIYNLVTEIDRSYIENLFYLSSIETVYPENKDNLVHFNCSFLKKPQKLGNFYEPMEVIGRIKLQEVENCQTLNADNTPKKNNKPFQLVIPQLCREVINQEFFKCEFISHHNFEWKFLFLDERAQSIIGFSSFEVVGTSGYDYYHIDDLDNMITHHKNLIMQDEGISGYYRFLTKGHQWIWLQTSSYVNRIPWNSRIEFIVCTHRVIKINFVEENEINLENNITTPNSCISSNTACSRLTSPLSWATTSTDKEEGSSQQYDDSVSSSSSGHQSFYQQKKRKTLRKLKQIRNMNNDCASSSSDTNSYNIVSDLRPLSITSTKDFNWQNLNTTDNLQKKCDALQKIIAESQEELRIVSQQLWNQKANNNILT